MYVKLIDEKEYIMKINKISLGGFRNVSKTILNMEDIIALISTNNYGKSNVLSGIKYGIDFIKASENEKSMMMRYVKGIPLNKELALENFQIEFEFSTEINNKEYIIQYGFEIEWFKSDETGEKILKEYLRLKEEEDIRFTLFINRNGSEAFYKSSDSGRCSSKISIEDNELVLNKLKVFDNLYYIEIIKRLNSIKFYIERHLDASSAYSKDFIVMNNKDELALENLRNIPRIVYNLKKDYEDKYKLLIDSFMQLFPEIKSISVDELTFPSEGKKTLVDVPFKINNQVYRIMVIDKNLNQPIDFAMMSDGAKRIFLQLVTIILAEIQGYSFVAIEEPENSIHPMLFQTYLRILMQFNGDSRIIVTSHSPYLLRYLELKDIFIGVPNNNGIATFRNMRKSKGKQIEKLADEFNMNVGDYLFEMLCGTEEDKEELKSMLEVF